MNMVKSFVITLIVILLHVSCVGAYYLSKLKYSQVSLSRVMHHPSLTAQEKLCRLRNSSQREETAEGIVELAEETTTESSAVRSKPKFMSQSNELAEDVLKPNFSDPKQTRVILYLILSLAPVIMLIPLMIGSRDFIPPEALPPVPM